MSFSFYDVSVESYLRTLRAVDNILQRAEHHAAESELDLEALVRYRLRDDTLPFSFQVISVWHHSYGAVQGMRAGEFNPPPAKPGIDYAGLCDLIDEGLAELQKETPESMAALSGQNMYFRFGKMEIPFTTDNFLATFSKPNLYFHATTTYTVLRQLGTPLGKLDFLGNMKAGH